MKKLVLTLIVSLAFCCSMFAQTNDPGWGEYPGCETNTAMMAYVQINGQLVTENFEALEIAYFVNGELRGHEYMIDDGDEYPEIQCTIQHYDNEVDAPVTFMMYDHANDILYENCTPNMTTVIGEEHWEVWDGYDLEECLILNFILEQEGYTLEIDAYNNEDNPKGNYYLISSPVGAVQAKNVEGLRTPNFDFYSFDQAQELEWINHRDDEDFELQQGIGYLYANNTGTDLTFYGDLLQDEIFVLDGLTFTEAGDGLDFPDYNLVGNPFYADAYLDQPFYTLVEGAFAQIQDLNTPLPRMQGAFVKGSADVTSVTFSKNPLVKVPTLALNLSNDGTVIDRAIVSFAEGQQMPKIQFNKNTSKVYIQQDGKEFALVRSEGAGEMPVSFKAQNNGTYSLNLTSENVEFSYLHLIDNLTGADQDLLVNPSYTFNASTTDYANRFRLVFATGNSDDNFAFFSNGSLVISNEGNATLQVIDVNGRILNTETISGSANVNVNAAPGVYMVRLINGDNVRVQKVVVK